MRECFDNADSAGRYDPLDKDSGMSRSTTGGLQTGKRQGLVLAVPLVLAALLVAAVCNTAVAQPSDLLGNAFKPGKGASSVDFTAKLRPVADHPDQVALTIDAKIPAGYHIYSTTPNSMVATTRIVISRMVGVAELDDKFTADHPPKTVTSVDGDYEEFTKRVKWTRKYALKPGTKPQDAVLEGLIHYGLCNDAGCKSPDPFKFKVTVVADPAAEEGAPVEATGPADELPPSAPAEQPAAELPAPPEEVPAAPPGRKLPDEVPAAPEAELPAAPPKELPSGFVPSKATYEHRQNGNSGPIIATWKASLTPKQAKPGDTVKLTVEVDLKSGWHVYSPNQKLAKDGTGPEAVGIRFGDIGSLQAVSPFRGPEPHAVDSEAWEGLKELHHEGHIAWTKEFVVPKDAAPGEIPINGGVGYQICSAVNCKNGGCQFKGLMSIGAATINDTILLAALPLDSVQAREIQEQHDEAEDGVVDVAASGGTPPGATGSRGAGSTTSQFKAQGLFLFLMSAVAAGFAALLTPCVFPMIPITVSFFHKQAEKKHHNAFAMASVYSLTIIGTFTGVGLFMSIFFGQGALNSLATNPYLNLVIGAVLVVFACNMLGMFEITMPSWLLTYTAGQESRGGYVGVMFMGLTFTLTSFTCTFAFVGTLLTWAVSGGGDWLWPVLGLLAFSAAFSLPFFFLALFPSVLRSLPKSGGWMNSVKVLMGLLEIGAALKFLSVADLMYFGKPTILDYELVISAWMVICITAGIYLLGMFRTPHDTPADHVGVGRLVMAMSLLGMGGYMAVGLFAADKPQGYLWEIVSVMAPPKEETEPIRVAGGPTAEPAITGPSAIVNGLQYHLDVDQALEHAIRENKPLFIDFTGSTCANCRQAERGPLRDPAVIQLLEKCVRVQVYADIVPRHGGMTWAESERLLKRNQEVQKKLSKSGLGLPEYLVVGAVKGALDDDSKVLSQSPASGDRTVEMFVDLLGQGIKAWESQGKAVANTTAAELAKGGLMMSMNGMPVHLDPDVALAQAIRQDRPLLLFMTGQNDVNSRLIENSTFREAAVLQQLKKYVVAKVYVDDFPATNRDERLRLKARHREIANRLERSQTPSLVVLAPQEQAFGDKDGMLSKDADHGDLYKVETCVAWLEQGLDAWAKQQTKAMASK